METALLGQTTGKEGTVPQTEIASHFAYMAEWTRAPDGCPSPSCASGTRACGAFLSLPSSHGPPQGTPEPPILKPDACRRWEPLPLRPLGYLYLHLPHYRHSVTWDLMFLFCLRSYVVKSNNKLFAGAGLFALCSVVLRAGDTEH